MLFFHRETFLAKKKTQLGIANERAESRVYRITWDKWMWALIFQKQGINGRMGRHLSGGQPGNFIVLQTNGTTSYL